MIIKKKYMIMMMKHKLLITDTAHKEKKVFVSWCNFFLGIRNFDKSYRVSIITAETCHFICNLPACHKPPKSERTYKLRNNQRALRT